MEGTMKRLLTYKELVEIFGQTINYWRGLYWKNLIKNCNPAPKGKHLFDANDINKLIEDSKAA